jgi:hypothetical protein
MTAPCTQRQFGFGLIVCMFVGAVPSMSYASTADQQRLCSSDAFRLCSSEIPNVDRVTICMRKHKASLSDGCKAVFDRPEPSSSTQ